MDAADDEEILSGGEDSRSGSWLPLALTGVVLAGAFGLVALRPHATPKPLAIVAKAGWSVGQDHGAHEATLTFELRNTGDAPVTIVRAGRSAPGVRLLHALAHRVADPDGLLQSGGGPLPLAIRGHSLAVVTLAYRVSRCDDTHRRSWPVPVTYRVGRSGTGTVLLTPGTRSGQLPWQRALTHGMCQGWFSYAPKA